MNYNRRGQVSDAVFIACIVVLVFAAHESHGAPFVASMTTTTTTQPATATTFELLSILPSTSRISGVAVLPSDDDYAVDDIYVSSISIRTSSIVARLINVTMPSSNITMSSSLFQQQLPAESLRILEVRPRASGGSMIVSRVGVEYPALAQVSALVNNSDHGGCLPMDEPMTFNSTFPVIPSALSIARLAAGTPRLVIADALPSARLFTILDPQLGSSGAAYLPLPLAGTACNFSTQFVVNNTKATATPLYSPQFVVQHAATGDVFVSQAFSVVRIAQATGIATYYFGDDGTPGTQDDSWNIDTTRWNATTNSPQQVCIDEVDSTMYVAESGMLTVRAVNMKTGHAFVVVGQFEYSSFPPSDCTLGNCTTSDVELVYPCAVAVYRSNRTGVAKHWLFVGDMTASVIYQVDLMTNKVRTIAGTMLRSGFLNGVAGFSRFSRIFTFAVGRRHLYIADGGLRVIELEAAIPRTIAPPQQPAQAPSPPPIQTAAESLVAASVVSSLASGGAATTEAVVLIMVAGVACSSTARGSSFLQMLFSLGMTAAPQVQCWVLLGIWLGLVALHAAIAVAVERRGERATAPSVTKILLGGSPQARFPSKSFSIGEILVPLSMAVAWTGVVKPTVEATAIVSGVLALAVAALSLVGTTWWVVVKHVSPTAFFEAYHWTTTPCLDTSGKASATNGSHGSDEHNASIVSVSSFASLLGSITSPSAGAAAVTSFEALFLPIGRWFPAEATKAFGHVFAKFAPEFRRSKVMEFVPVCASSVLTAVASQYHDAVGCKITMTLLGAIYIASSALVAWLRPYRLPADNVLVPASYALFAALCLLKSFAPDNASAADVVQMIQTVVILARSILAIVMWYRERLHTSGSASNSSSRQGSMQFVNALDALDGGTTLPAKKDGAMHSTSFAQDTSALDKNFFTSLHAPVDEAVNIEKSESSVKQKAVVAELSSEIKEEDDDVEL